MSELLATPHGTMAVLNQFGIRAKKKYGQNFLISRGIVDQIIDAAEISKEDCVLEIGPGIGTMTQLLSQAAGHVVAVEIDESLEPVLATTLEDCTNVTVQFRDILKTDLEGICREFNHGEPLKCVANLPYYITTPILLQLFQKAQFFQSITVMVQKEVADRILATEKDKEYGALSLAVRYYSEPQRVCVVPPNCFIPRPGVDSAVLCLQMRKKPPVDANPELLFALIRAAFNQRRKTLANAVSHGFSYQNKEISREQIQTALANMGLSDTIRGEKLSLEQFAELARQLDDMLNF